LISLGKQLKVIFLRCIRSKMLISDQKSITELCPLKYVD